MERIKTGWFFERYWTKSTRKKNAGDAPNPDNKSMHKLGVCSMTIEPHVFEVTLYTVRGPSVTFLPPVSQAAAQKPSTSSGYYHSHIAPAPPAARPSSNIYPTQPKPSTAPMSNASPPAPSPKVTQNLTPTSTAPPQLDGASDQKTDLAAHTTSAVSDSLQQQPQPAQTVQPIKQSPPPPTPPATASAPPAQTPDTVSSTNPVIQMLAQRASIDPNLKALMKIVANGTASPDELKTFQRHIDELNSIIKGTHPPGQSQRSPADNVAVSKPQINTSSTLPQTQTWSVSQPGVVKQEPLSQYYSQQPHYSKPRPGPVSKQDISAIVFDITGGNGDRYLIPKKSILEYLPGSPQVLVSFLVTRKGSEADQGSYKGSVEYFQPVTMKLSCLHHKVLEPLAKVVEPLDAVRKYMEEVMSKAKRAEDAYLMIQLPRSNAGEQREKIDAERKMEASSDGSGYDPPNSILPLRVAPANK